LADFLTKCRVVTAQCHSAVRGTATRVRYDRQTGADQGSSKLRLLLTVSRSGDEMSGTVVLDVFAPTALLSGRSGTP
jgi:hypothetical protein